MAEQKKRAKKNQRGTSVSTPEKPPRKEMVMTFGPLTEEEVDAELAKQDAIARGERPDDGIPPRAIRIGRSS